MAMSKNPNRYRDIQLLCDIALKNGECVWRADVANENPSRVNYLQQRFYQFIRLIEKINPNSTYIGLQSTADPVTGELTIYPQIKRIEDGIITEYDAATLDREELLTTEYAQGDDLTQEELLKIAADNLSNDDLF